MTFRVDKKDLLYFIAIFLVSFFKGFGLVGEDFLYKIVMFIAIVLCGTKILLDLKSGIEKKKLIEIFVVCIIFVINYFIILDVTLLISVFFFLAIRNTSLKTSLIVILFSKILSFLLNIIFVKTGIRKENVGEMYRDGIIFRSDFAFGHPNTFHYMYASIIVLILVLFFKRIKFIHLLLILFLNLLVYNISLSRTGFYNIILSVLLFILIRYSFFKKFICYSMRYAQIFFVLLTYILVALFNKYSFVKDLDILLTGRIGYSYEQINLGISIFGKNFNGTGIFLDNSYSALTTMYGFVIAGIFLYLYAISAKFLIKKNVESLILMFLIFSIYMFTEGYIVSSVVNLTLLVISKIYFNETEKLMKDFS